MRKRTRKFLYGDEIHEQKAVYPRLSNDEEALRLLTRGDEYYSEYIEWIATSGNWIAIIVKRADPSRTNLMSLPKHVPAAVVCPVCDGALPWQMRADSVVCGPKCRASRFRIRNRLA